MAHVNKPKALVVSHRHQYQHFWEQKDYTGKRTATAACTCGGVYPLKQPRCGFRCSGGKLRKATMSFVSLSAIMQQLGAQRTGFHYTLHLGRSITSALQKIHVWLKKTLYTQTQMDAKSVAEFFRRPAEMSEATKTHVACPKIVPFMRQPQKKKRVIDEHAGQRPARNARSDRRKREK
jgi:hypothetical protein